MMTKENIFFLVRGSEKWYAINFRDYERQYTKCVLINIVDFYFTVNVNF